MEIEHIDHEEGLRITRGEEVKEYFHISGFSPTHRSEKFERQDRKPVRNLVDFLWWELHADTYARVNDEGTIEIFASMRGDAMEKTAYLQSKINSLTTKKLKVGSFKKDIHGNKSRRKDGTPIIPRGTVFEIQNQHRYTIPHPIPQGYSALQLTRPHLWRRDTKINLTIVPEKYILKMAPIIPYLVGADYHPSLVTITGD